MLSFKVDGSCSPIPPIFPDHWPYQLELISVGAWPPKSFPIPDVPRRFMHWPRELYLMAPNVSPNSCFCELKAAMRAGGWMDGCNFDAFAVYFSFSCCCLDECASARIVHSSQQHGSQAWTCDLRQEGCRQMKTKARHQVLGHSRSGAVKKTGERSLFGILYCLQYVCLHWTYTAIEIAICAKCHIFSGLIFLIWGSVGVMSLKHKAIFHERHVNCVQQKKVILEKSGICMSCINQKGAILKSVSHWKTTEVKYSVYLLLLPDQTQLV